MELSMMMQAQEAAREAAEAAAGSSFVLTSPHFYVAVIAGVILAAAFQLVLTDLALAGGLNIVGASIGPDDKPPRRDRRPQRPTRGEKEVTVLDKAHTAARKLSAAFGFWTLVSVSLSVFFAAWLAVLLSGTFSPLFGALLGLVIWALFTGLMTTLEARLLSSMLGALVHTARTALRDAAGLATSAASSLFGASPRKQATDIAHDVAAAVRDEILGGEDVKHQLRDYLKRVERIHSPKNIRMELEKLLDHTEIDYVFQQPDAWLDENRVIETITSGGRMKPEQARTVVRSLKDAIRLMREEHARGGSRLDQVTGTAMRMAGLSREDAQRYRQQVEDYLRSTGKEALNPEGIKRDLEQLLHDPRAGAQSLGDRLSHIDRDTVTAVLAERTDMTHDDAQRIVDRFMGVVESITGGASAGAELAQEQLQLTQEQAEGLRERINTKIRDYLDSLNEPELGYEGVRHDVELLFHDPRAAVEALTHRLQSIDRDTIKTMLAHRKDISDDDAERIIRRVEEARDSVLHRAEQVRDEIEFRVEQAQYEARRQAEATAHTASTAAWWAFGTAVVSAGAAALGGAMPAL